MEKASSGVTGKFLRDGWYSADSIGPDDGSEEVVNRLYALPVVDRSFSRSSLQSFTTGSSMASEK